MITKNPVIRFVILHSIFRDYELSDILSRIQISQQKRLLPLTVIPNPRRLPIQNSKLAR
jgi:hypothetical protein